jgi:hypothetical protein
VRREALGLAAWIELSHRSPSIGSAIRGAWSLKTVSPGLVNPGMRERMAIARLSLNGKRPVTNR